jgi:hypothetical protein
MKIPRDIGASELIRALRVLGYESLPQDGSHFPIKNPKSSIENRQSTPLPMGFTLTFPVDQSVRRPRQCLLFETGPDDVKLGPSQDCSA